MQTPTPPPSATPTSKSKRKRHTTDSASHLSPSPTRLKTTDLPSRPLGCLDDEINPSGSPRTTITGHLQELDIQEQDGAASKLDFGMGKRKSESSTGAFAPQVLLPKNQTYSNNDNNSTIQPVTPSTNSHGLYPNLAQPTSSYPHPGPPSILEFPESPPTTASASTTTTTTHQPPTPDPRLGNKSPIHTSNPATPSSSSLWWTDTEITGHNPSDPTDDGYGINGVGFVPTPAMASARAEKRRRQVREWKEREARDARARRGLRRQRNRGGEGKVGLEDGAGGREEGMDGGRKVEEGGRKEVRFSDVMEVEVG